AGDAAEAELDHARRGVEPPDLEAELEQRRRHQRRTAAGVEDAAARVAQHLEDDALLLLEGVLPLAAARVFGCLGVEQLAHVSTTVHSPGLHRARIPRPAHAS